MQTSLHSINRYIVACVLGAGIVLGTLPNTQAHAQAVQQHDTEDQWRSKPPSLSQPRFGKLRKICNYQLSNGMKVKLVEDHRVPWTTIYVGVRAGTVDDPDNSVGTAVMVADMIDRGTRNRTSQQIAEEIDCCGGAIGAIPGPDFTYLTASGLSTYNQEIVRQLSDVLRNPTFPEEELAAKKQSKMQEFKMERVKPEFIVDELCSRVLFGQHRYGVVAPSAQSIAKLTRESLLQFHRAMYVPDSVVLVAVGDFQASNMKRLIEEQFSSWQGHSVHRLAETPVPFTSGLSIYLVDRPGAIESTIKVCCIALKRTDPDFHTAQVLNQIYGGGAMSRLFLNLRERNGFTYGAFSQLVTRRESGIFSASTSVPCEVTGATLKEVFLEMRRIREEPVSKTELKAAKTFVLGSFLLGLETQGMVAQRLLDGELYNLPDRYVEKYSTQVKAVTSSDVNRIARRTMNPNNLVVCVVGDKTRIATQLEELGTLTICDTTGRGSH